MIVKKERDFVSIQIKNKLHLSIRQSVVHVFVFNFFLGKQKERDTYWSIIEEMVQNGQLFRKQLEGGVIQLKIILLKPCEN